MREYRLSKDTTEHYTSLQELRAAWGCKEKVKDAVKMKGLQDKFCEKYKCPACDMPMGYIGGGLMTCVNDKCKGIRNEREDKEGNKYVTYDVSYKYVKDYDSSYAEYIFS